MTLDSVFVLLSEAPLYLSGRRWKASEPSCPLQTSRDTGEARFTLYLKFRPHWVIINPLAPQELSYRGTSVIRNRRPLGTYSRTKPRALWWP